MAALASSCEWLAIVLEAQERILDLATALADASDATSWSRRFAALELAIERHFRLEETLLQAAIQAMGQRAHTVVADARRLQVRRNLEDLRVPSWEDECVRVWQLRVNLTDHFAQEEAWSCQALARDQDEAARARLSAACRALRNAS